MIVRSRERGSHHRGFADRIGSSLDHRCVIEKERVRLEVRKVQKVGHSTLTVSLPRDWVDQVGLKQGAIVTLRRAEDGTLKLVPGAAEERKESTVSKINADLCDERELLARVITGNYILGRDTFVVSSKKELSAEHLWEIRSTVQRLTGLGIVEQSPKQVVIQSFLDPTKFPVQGLMTRLHRVGLSMQETAIMALRDRRPDLAGQVLQMENEADRIYWLIIRQLLLVTADLRLGKEIGIASPLHVLGNRMIAKYLEGMADCAENIAKEALAIKDEDYLSLTGVLNELLQFSRYIKELSEGAMRAFSKLDVRLANKIIEAADRAEARRKKLTERILLDVQQRNVAVALRATVGNLGEISKYCDMIAEVTINRYLEEPSDICVFGKA